MTDTIVTILHIHMVFVVAKSSVGIDDKHRDDLHSALARLVERCDCKPLAIGSTSDHLHLFIDLNPERSVHEIARRARLLSSRMLGSRLRDGRFRWRKGYYAFTSSPSARMQVVAHIDDQ